MAKAKVVTSDGLFPWQASKDSNSITGLFTAKEAIQKGELDWQVKLEPVFDKDGTQIPKHQAVIRQDNRVALGVVGKRYEPVQNNEAFDYFDSIVGSGQATYDVVGSIDDGRKIWLLAKLDGKQFINGQEHEKMILFVTSHDGSTGLNSYCVHIRPICTNTLVAAIRTASNQFKIKHTRNYEHKIKEAQKVFGFANNYFDKLKDVLEHLGQKDMSLDEMRGFANRLVPAVKDGVELKGDEVPTRTQNIREDVIGLFNRGAGNLGKNRLDALNAVTDYVDHRKQLRGEGSSRFEVALLGDGARMKQDAVDLLLA